MMVALIAGMVGCGDGGGYNPPPSQNLEIRTWYDLDAVRDNLAGNHTLMNDLDSTTAGYEELASPTANQGKGWQPIGTFILNVGSFGFEGTFDGQGHEIRDLFINRPDEDSVGLFKYVDDGVIEDVGVTNVTVIGEDAVGALAGGIYGGAITVSNSHSSGSVTGNDDVGGLAGRASCIVIDSYFSGSVTGYEYVGGLVGENFGTVSKSHFTGNATGSSSVGGLVGDNHWSLGDPRWPDVNLLGVDVSNSYYDLDESLINGENRITIGALSGEDCDQWLANDKFLDINERLSQENGYYLINDVSDFKQLLAFGQNANLKFRLTSDLNLATEPGFYIPYLAGEFDGNGHKISNLSFNSGFVCYVGLFGYLCRAGEVSQVGVENINITGAGFVGGLVGQSYGTVSDSYSSGSVTGNKWYVGGLVGWNIKATVKVGNKEWNIPGAVSNSYSTASVSGGDMVGGLIGLNEGDASNSYSTGSVTGYEYVGGLVGMGDVSDSYFTGSVTGEDAVGGLAGIGLGSNSYYNYDEVLINGENIITIGALSGDDFDQWLANDKFLDVNGRLSQEDGYYLINDVNDLKQLLAVGQNASLKFRLTNDLDLATEPNFYIPYLAGEFDGNSHKISNLSFEFEFVSYVGLFGFLARGGNVTKVGDENVNVTGNYYVCGLVGFSTGSVSHSYSTGSVSGHEDVGGLVGYNLGTVSNSHSTTSVTGDEDVGGLVGENDYGLEGADGIVSNSYSTGSVTGTTHVGGLVGYNLETVTNSYSTGSVTGYDYVGGLVGISLTTVSNSYSTGSVSGATHVGGLVGRGIIVSNSFWDVQTSGRSTSDGGTGKTTAAMKSIATFSGAGWNIIAVANPSTRNPAYIWNIVNGVTYPFLSWQP
jgi:hypothetical protein